MSEKQEIIQLARAVQVLARKVRDQQEEIAALARTLALTDDALAQFLDGRMSQRDAAGNLHNLNAQAASVFRKAS